VDTLSPGLALRKREDLVMARKTYSEEFRREAVELYRSTPGATVVGIAADLGIMDSTLSAWLKAAGVAVRGPVHRAQASPPPDGETPAQEVTRPAGQGR
jgi:transposase